jgi:hypothetical protein
MYQWCAPKNICIYRNDVINNFLTETWVCTYCSRWCYLDRHEDKAGTLMLDNDIFDMAYLSLLFCIVTVFIDSRLTRRLWRKRQHGHAKHRKTSTDYTASHSWRQYFSNWYKILIFLSICLSIHPSMALQSFVGPWSFFFFSFLIFYTVGRTPWTGDQPVTRLIPPKRIAQTQCLKWVLKSRSQFWGRWKQFMS